ncbi:MAG: putative oxidoreductase [Blastocatellia bacterium]
MDLGIKRIRGTWAALPLELIAGVIFFAHGLQKIGDPAGFAQRAMGGIPLFLSYLVIAAEFGGGLLLLMGLFVRLGALGQLCVMVVAISQVHWSNGLSGPGGFEFPLALLAAALALLILGGDPLSIDDNISISIYRSRTAAARSEVIDTASPLVKAAGLILILGGILMPVARHYIGLADGNLSLVILIIAGVISLAVGGAVAAGKPWAYLPAFVVARLYLAASALLLFYVRYTLRGLAAMFVSLLVLAALRSARRGMTESSRVY